MAVALYARVSTTRQADKDLSIPDQLRQLREWCERNGHVVAQEYIEPGASATDDRRPAFQQMIAKATAKHAPFNLIVVHSLSRFFRDMIELAVYERKLNRSGVKLVSITQQTSDDPAGEMMRRVISLFDEYQSKENGKHTLRAMKENARQGYFNGARTPFGYRVEELDLPAAKGRKKRLVIDESEAVVVRRVFDLYLNGFHGREMGTKQIAAHFNERGPTLRGSEWTRTRVLNMLSDTTNMGDYVFNRINNKSRKVKSQEEWVHLSIPAIVTPELFEETKAKRESRAPKMVPPRLLSSPTLLTGRLRCANCGAGMTLATGKSGRYRYYKCNTRIAKGASLCTTPAVSMDKMDQAVLTTLAERVVTPERLKLVLVELKGRLKKMQAGHEGHIRGLQRELQECETSINRLLDAVEKDLLPMDDMLKSRAQKLKARREAVLLEIAGARRAEEMPAVTLKPAQVEAFTAAVRARLLAGGEGFAKRYVQQLVTEVTFDGHTITMTGRKDALVAATMGKEKGTAWVPRSSGVWLPDLGSNQGPAD